MFISSLMCHSIKTATGRNPVFDIDISGWEYSGMIARLLFVRGGETAYDAFCFFFLLHFPIDVYARDLKPSSFFLSTCLLSYYNMYFGTINAPSWAELYLVAFLLGNRAVTLVRSKTVIVKTEDGTGKGIDNGLDGSVSLGSLVEIQSSHQCKWKRLWTYNCNFRGCDEHSRRRATAFPRLSPSNFPSA